MTTYVVLKTIDPELLPEGAGDDAFIGWVMDGVYEGQTATQAIRAAIRADGGGGGAAYAAIPQRSWKPVTVTIEATPRVKLTEA